MNAIKIYLIAILNLIMVTELSAYAKTLFVEKVVFPPSLEAIPPIRAFYAGRKISGEIEGNNVTFSFPELRRNFFYLLISHDLEFCSPNAVTALRLKRNARYKLYALELAGVENKKRTKTPHFSYTWNVKELLFPLVENRIPDDTVIVWYNPDFIQGLEGGNLIELPKIIIRPDILTFVGSEERLHRLSNAFLLSALNFDSIHDTISHEVAQTASPKTVLALTS